MQLMKFLNAMKGPMSSQWCVDASFAVHPDFRSHGRLVGKFKGGKGLIQCGLDKQKLNKDGSTTAELVGTHQHPLKILFAPLFLSEQGCDVDVNEVMQDNKSAIPLEKNGKKSSRKRTRALNARHFLIMDQCQKGNLKIMHCPTDKMIADFMTKGFSREKFAKFHKEVMGMD